MLFKSYYLRVHNRGILTITAVRRSTGEKIGLISFNTNVNKIERFYIEKAFDRQKGIGTAMFKKLVKILRRNGIEVINAFPSPETEIQDTMTQEEIEKIYKALGFKMAEEQPLIGPKKYQYFIKNIG